MISIDRFPAFKGEPAGVRVTFTYIEPTHEVAEALTAAGIRGTEAFRSIHLAENVDPWPAGGLSEDMVAFRLDMIEEALMEHLGEAIYKTQSDKLTAHQAVEFVTEQVNP